MKPDTSPDVPDSRPADGDPGDVQDIVAAILARTTGAQFEPHRYPFGYAREFFATHLADFEPGEARPGGHAATAGGDLGPDEVDARMTRYAERTGQSHSRVVLVLADAALSERGIGIGHEQRMTAFGAHFPGVLTWVTPGVSGRAEEDRIGGDVVALGDAADGSTYVVARTPAHEHVLVISRLGPESELPQEVGYGTGSVEDAQRFAAADLVRRRVLPDLDRMDADGVG